MWTAEFKHHRAALMDDAERAAFSDAKLRARGLMEPGGAGNSKSRYRVMADARALVLHFNGKHKPWRPDPKLGAQGGILCGRTVAGLVPCAKRWEAHWKPLKAAFKKAVALAEAGR